MRFSEFLQEAELKANVNPDTHVTRLLRTANRDNDGTATTPLEPPKTAPPKQAKLGTWSYQVNLPRQQGLDLMSMVDGDDDDPEIQALKAKMLKKRGGVTPVQKTLYQFLKSVEQSTDVEYLGYVARDGWDAAPPVKSLSELSSLEGKTAADMPTKGRVRLFFKSKAK